MCEAVGLAMAALGSLFLSGDELAVGSVFIGFEFQVPQAPKGTRWEPYETQGSYILRCDCAARMGNDEDAAANDAKENVVPSTNMFSNDLRYDRLEKLLHKGLRHKFRKIETVDEKEETEVVMKHSKFRPKSNIKDNNIEEDIIKKIIQRENVESECEQMFDKFYHKFKQNWEEKHSVQLAELEPQFRSSIFKSWKEGYLQENDSNDS